MLYKYLIFMISGMWPQRESLTHYLINKMRTSAVYSEIIIGKISNKIVMGIPIKSLWYSDQMGMKMNYALCWLWPAVVKQSYLSYFSLSCDFLMILCKHVKRFYDIPISGSLISIRPRCTSVIFFQIYTLLNLAFL